MKKYGWLLILFAVLFLAAGTPAMASLAEAGETVTEGAVEFPTGLVKLVGGLVWMVGEVIILPFTLIF
jgi:hypothetical protein